jgi:hypothetical protein
MVKVVLVLVTLLVKVQGKYKATGKQTKTKAIYKTDKLIVIKGQANQSYNQRKRQAKAE